MEEHEHHHLPYRNWCPICVKAKGKDADHRKGVNEERGLSEHSFDYCFPGDQLGFKWTVSAGRERVSGMQFGTAVPTKGSSGKFSVDKAYEFIEEIGDSHADIIVVRGQRFEPILHFRVVNRAPNLVRFKVLFGNISY